MINSITLTLIFIICIFGLIYIINSDIFISNEILESNNKDVIFSSPIDYNINSTTKIPLKIFQTWHSKTLPPKMKKCVINLKKNNPEFEHYLFDDIDCREFIKTHFEEPVLKSFDALKPGAFKADLWRYCVLYIHGGIYLDIKYCCVDNFKLIDLTDDEYFVKDYGNEWAVYNAFMVCKPKNNILMNCIKQIVHNVETKFYGSSCLEVTGPRMMIKFLSPNEKKKLKRITLNTFNSTSMLYITDSNNRIILQNYPEYKRERKNNQLFDHYSILWAKKQIYNDIQ